MGKNLKGGKHLSKLKRRGKTVPSSHITFQKKSWLNSPSCALDRHSSWVKRNGNQMITHIQDKEGTSNACRRETKRSSIKTETCHRREFNGLKDNLDEDMTDDNIQENNKHESCHIEKLPEEVVIYLCKNYLSTGDAFNLSETNQHFSRILKNDRLLWSIVAHKEDIQKSKEHFEWITLATKELEKISKGKKIPSYRHNILASQLALRWAIGKPVRYFTVAYMPQCLEIQPIRVLVNDNYVIYEYPNDFERTDGTFRHSSISKECKCAASIFNTACQVWKLDNDDVNVFGGNNKTKYSFPPYLLYNRRISDSEWKSFGFKEKCQPSNSYSKWQVFGSPLPKSQIKELTIIDTSIKGAFRIGDYRNREKLKSFDLEHLVCGDVVNVQLVAHFIVCQILYKSSWHHHSKEGLAIININHPPSGPEEVKVFGILPALSNGTTRHMVVGIKRILRFDRNDVRYVQVDSFL